ncbi:MAG: hypothetical protein IKE89_01815 [Bacilli bacterium]|nr:hypothetical protein [Bacilli bacterium]
MKKKYLSTIFFVTAISLTLSGCNDYKDRQFEQEVKAANEQIAMNNDDDPTNDKPVNEKDFKGHVVDFDDDYSNSNGDLYDSVKEIIPDETNVHEELPNPDLIGEEYDNGTDSEIMYDSLKNADAKLKEILEDETLSQRLIASGNEMSTEEAEHIDNLTGSISKIITTYIDAIDNKDMETCNKCNRALGIIYDLHKEIYEVVIGNKIPEGNEAYLVGDIDNENTIIRGPYMSVFSDKNALNTTQWLANMDEYIFDEYVVVENTGENINANTSYIVDVTDYNERIADQLLTIKEDYSDIYGFNPEDVEIRWIGSDEEGSFGFINKDTGEPYGLIDGLTANTVNAVIQEQKDLENRTINVYTYEQLLQQEKSMETHTKRI